MLTPRKSVNLEASVLRIFALMLCELQKRGVVEFERLRALVVRRIGSEGEPVFLSAPKFLFLLRRVNITLKTILLNSKLTTMQISGVYCNHPEILLPVRFNYGLDAHELNVVLGEVRRPTDKKRDSHNLGKTTLLTL
jgi:hypothetical protein